MNILKINGTALTGIYVDAAVSFNKPAKRVETFSVPGRNGDLVIDEGTFDNVLISYPVYEKSTFPDEFDAIVNWLASLQGYQRIECSNDPQHYRLGRFVVPQNPTAKRLNRDGYYQLSFDCKPQRWLLSGEEDTEITANPATEYTGDVVTFTANALDEITGLTAEITPIQNLNGQANPYPAGGGKNLCPMMPTTTHHYITFTPRDDGGYTISGTASGGNGVMDIGRDFWTLPAGTYYLSLSGTSNAQISIFKIVGGTASQVRSGNGSFTLSEETSVFVRLLITNGTAGSGIAYVQVETGSSSTSFAPYSNSCPISGHTEVNVVRTGKNLLSGVSVGAINTTTGQETTGNNTISPLIKVKPSTAYTVSPMASSGAIRFFEYDASGAFISSSTTNGTTSATYTTSANTAYIRIQTSSAIMPVSGSYQIEVGSTATTYETFGQTYPISLGQTVYGGTLNVTTGVLTITWAMDVYDGTEGGWQLQSINSYGIANFQRAVSDSKAVTNPAITNILPAQSTVIANTQTEGFYLNSVHVLSVRINSSRANTVALFKTWLASNNLQLCYELATPITVQLTPTEVTTLLGVNNIWADTGDVTVEVTGGTLFNNPSPFNAKPLIRVYGIGTFRINDNVVTIASHDKPYIDIDCELQECYYEGENMSAYVSFSDNDYPVLVPDDNYVLMVGVTKLDVTPRWWIL